MKITPINTQKSNSYNFKNSLLSKTQVNSNFKGLSSMKSAALKSGYLAFLPALITDFLEIITSSPILNTTLLSALSIVIFSLAGKIIEKPKQLVENIEFKKAESIEEAANFAKNTFKIKKFDVSDLELANWINEGLCNINNRFKGKVHMPAKIKEVKNKNYDGRYNLITDTLFILNNKDGMFYNEEFLLSYMELSLLILEDYKIGPKQEELCEKVRKFIDNPQSVPIIERRMLYDATSRCIQMISKARQNVGAGNLFQSNGKYVSNEYGPVDYNPFEIIYHEMGHVFDNKATPFKIKVSRWFKKIKSDLTVHNYMLKDSGEYVAECFAGFMNGERYSKKIEDTFHKITNIRFPDIETDVPLKKGVNL